MQGVFQSVAATFSGLLNVTPLIAEATENTSKPTPGYLYNEIAQLTFKSTDTCLQVLEALIERMETPQPWVKLKALNISKHCLQKGSTAFIREMSRKHEVVRECVMYRGEKDPLHGDALNSQIRDVAQQVINMIFDTQPSYQSSSMMQGSTGDFRSEYDTVSPPRIPVTFISSDMVHNNNSSNNSHIGSPYNHPMNGGSSISSYSTQQGSKNNYQVSTTYLGATSDGGTRVYKNTPKAIGSYIEYTPSTFDSVVEKVGESFESFVKQLTSPQPPASSGRSGPNSGNGARMMSQGGVRVNAPPTYNFRHTVAPVSVLDDNNVNVEGNSFYHTEDKTSEEFGKLTDPELMPFYSQMSNAPESILASEIYSFVVKSTPALGRLAPTRSEISNLLHYAKEFVLSLNNTIGPLIDALFLRILCDDTASVKYKSVCLIKELLSNEIGDTRDYLQSRLKFFVYINKHSIGSAMPSKLREILQIGFPESPEYLELINPVSRLPAQNEIIQISTNGSNDTSDFTQNTESSLFANLETVGQKPTEDLVSMPTSPSPPSTLLESDGIFSGLNFTESSSKPQTSETSTQDIFESLLAPRPQPIQKPQILESSKPSMQQNLIDFDNWTPSTSEVSSTQQNKPSLLDDMLLPTSQSSFVPNNNTQPIQHPTLSSTQIPSNSVDIFASLKQNSAPSKPIGEIQPMPLSTLTLTTSEINYIPSQHTLTHNILFLKDKIHKLHMMRIPPMSATLTPEQLLNVEQEYTQTQETLDQLTAQLESLQTINHTHLLTTTTTGNLESLYRQSTNSFAVPAYNSPNPSNTLGDLEAIQKSHPADPFSFVRDEMKR